jgi:hypothetical protein
MVECLINKHKVLSSNPSTTPPHPPKKIQCYFILWEKLAEISLESEINTQQAIKYYLYWILRDR